jgi:hypothetical protein
VMSVGQMGPLNPKSGTHYERNFEEGKVFLTTDTTPATKIESPRDQFYRTSFWPKTTRINFRVFKIRRFIQ